MDVPKMPNTARLGGGSRKNNGSSSKNLMNQTMNLDEKRKLLSATPSIMKSTKLATGGASI